MKPSIRILDENMTQLMQRAYQPVHPRAEFVQELEQALGPWIAEEQVEHGGLRALRSLGPWVASSLAMAAAVMLLFGWFHSQERAGQRPTPVVLDLEGLLQAGDVALRLGPDGDWRAATAIERENGLALTGSSLSLAVPADLDFHVYGSEGWSTTLGSQSQMTTELREGTLWFTLASGSARFAGGGNDRELQAPATVGWRAGAFLSGDGQAWGTVVEAPTNSSTSDRLALGDSVPVAEAEELVESDNAPVEPGFRLDGVVTSLIEGQIIQGFDVSLLRSVPLPQVATTFTRHFDGSEFSWDALKPGTYQVYITADEHAVWKRQDLLIEAGQELELSAQLNAGGTVRGFVVERSTGAAIAGALVLSEGDMPTQIVGMGEKYFPDGARAFTYSASDGSFELPLLGLGAQSLRASVEGLAPTWLQAELGPRQLDGLLFELSEGGSVEGRCEHPNGQPFVEGMVVLSRFGMGGGVRAMTFEQTYTDENGHYLVEHLSPGGYITLFFGLPEIAESYQTKYVPVEVTQGKRERVDFLGEDRGGCVRGTVFDDKGQPVPFANLHLIDAEFGTHAWKGETTNELGQYEVIGLKEGRYHVFAGVGNATAWGATLDLTVGNPIVQDLHLTGTELKVTVVDDATGGPLPLTELSLLESGTEPALGGGKFAKLVRKVHLNPEVAVMRFINTANYDLVVLTQSSRYAIGILRNLWIEEGTPVQEVEVRLKRACRATVNVVDGDGEPIVGASVRAQALADGEWLPLTFKVSDSEGHMRLRRLFPGPWRIQISHADYSPEWLELDCSPGRPARGRVVLGGE